VLHRGLRPHNRQITAAVHKNTSRLVEHYAEQAEARHRQHSKEIERLQQIGATGFQHLQDMLEAKFAALTAKQDAMIWVLKEEHATEIWTLNGRILTLNGRLSDIEITQTRMAASVAHHQQQQLQQHQQPQQQQQQQQPQQPQRQQQGSRNPNPPFQPMRPAPELDEEEFPSLPTSKWKVREGRYTQRVSKRWEHEEEVAMEKEQERREREKKEKERERVPRARGPPLLTPKVLYPRAERQIVVTFDPLKRPEGMDDKHVASMALQLVNKAIVNRKDVRTPPLFSARITPKSNLILVAADHVQ
jgi:hypothetical protein